MDEIKTFLARHLGKMGLSPNMIPGFLKSVSNLLNEHPEMSLSEINDKLQYLGWDGIEMNYHTLELAKAWHESLANTPVPNEIESLNIPERPGSIL